MDVLLCGCVADWNANKPRRPKSYIIKVSRAGGRSMSKKLRRHVTQTVDRTCQ